MSSQFTLVVSRQFLHYVRSWLLVTSYLQSSQFTLVVSRLFLHYVRPGMSSQFTLVVSRQSLHYVRPGMGYRVVHIFNAVGLFLVLYHFWGFFNLPSIWSKILSNWQKSCQVDSKFQDPRKLKAKKSASIPWIWSMLSLQISGKILEKCQEYQKSGI